MEWRGPRGKLFGACFDAFSRMYSDSERREKLISPRRALLPPPLPDAFPSRLLTRLAAPCVRP